MSQLVLLHKAIQVVGINRDGQTAGPLIFERDQKGEIVYGELWSGTM